MSTALAASIHVCKLPGMEVSKCPDRVFGNHFIKPRSSVVQVTRLLETLYSAKTYVGRSGSDDQRSVLERA